MRAQSQPLTSIQAYASAFAPSRILAGETKLSGRKAAHANAVLKRRTALRTSRF